MHSDRASNGSTQPEVGWRGALLEINSVSARRNGQLTRIFSHRIVTVNRDEAAARENIPRYSLRVDANGVV